MCGLEIFFRPADLATQGQPIFTSSGGKKINFIFLPCVLFFKKKSLICFFSKSAMIFKKKLFPTSASMPRDSPLTAAATGPHGVGPYGEFANFMPVSADFYKFLTNDMR